MLTRIALKIAHKNSLRDRKVHLICLVVLLNNTIQRALLVHSILLLSKGFVVLSRSWEDTYTRCIRKVINLSKVHKLKTARGRISHQFQTTLWLNNQLSNKLTKNNLFKTFMRVRTTKVHTLHRHRVRSSTSNLYLVNDSSLIAHFIRWLPTPKNHGSYRRSNRTEMIKDFTQFLSRCNLLRLATELCLITMSLNTPVSISNIQHIYLLPLWVTASFYHNPHNQIHCNSKKLLKQRRPKYFIR